MVTLYWSHSRPWRGGRSYGDQNQIFAKMSCHIFLPMVLRARGAPLLIFINLLESIKVNCPSLGTEKLTLRSLAALRQSKLRGCELCDGF